MATVAFPFCLEDPFVLRLICCGFKLQHLPLHSLFSFIYGYDVNAHRWSIQFPSKSIPAFLQYECWACPNTYLNTCTFEHLGQIKEIRNASAQIIKCKDSKCGHWYRLNYYRHTIVIKSRAKCFKDGFLMYSFLKFCSFQVTYCIFNIASKDKQPFPFLSAAFHNFKRF